MDQPLTRPDGSAPRILVVDDEENLAQLLAMAFSYQSWEPRTAGSVQQALTAARQTDFDAAVLDIMLPDGDGVDLMARLRTRDADLPVLFLTAKDAIDDRVTGLRAGGDDYVTKPFNLDEVVARVEALLRRSLGTGAGADRILAVGDLTVDLGSREVSRAGHPIELTAKEFDVLALFARNPRLVLSKATILDRVWGYDFGGSGNIVELYVSYLRRKLEAPFPDLPALLQTKRGAGYMLVP
ncbi:MAG TPA: response regulator transcription factor [Brevibacterium senegalense]|uniref:Response regulator transcription factor n=1 Tax=Brevibacterium senegalense TaxID=1033736 RepID=A0A921MEJ3_9MICO|nr:response regulator transcription factor [Brevibacterium senegalense]